MEELNSSCSENIMKAKSSKGAAKARKTEATKDALCDFYTSHPYPPPVENLDRARDMWQYENVHRGEFHLLWPDREYRADFDVLVAGCGTFQASKFALCHPRSRVTGIDVSETSLTHTRALKEKYDLTNLEAQQFAIENVADLGQQFDLIVCTGVLHHLIDPDAGLRALRSVLRPDGAMYLMLYAPYGRIGVHMLQEYCRKLGVGVTPEEVNDLTEVLQQLPQHHPLVAMLRGSRDALNAKALIDALLNPRDRAYSVAELFAFIERQDLSFGRWYWQAPYLPQCGAASATPHTSRLAALPLREQYEEMELWRGLMTNHDFVVHASSASNGNAKVRFDDKSYLQYVPIRRAWTMCVKERLPPGAAGVLVNQTHLFHDLFLLIDEQEKQMYEAINGKRSVAEIVEQTTPKEPAAFFEKLWQYDQVVFDTSKAS